MPRPPFKFAAGAALAALSATAGSAQDPRYDSRYHFNDGVVVQQVTMNEVGVQVFDGVDDLMGMVHRRMGVFSKEGIVRGWERTYDHEAALYAAVPVAKRAPNYTGLTWIRDFNVASNENTACVIMHIMIPIGEGSGGPVNKWAFPEMDVWRKYGARYLASFLHIGTPIDPVTGKPVHDHMPPVRGAVKWSASPLAGPAADPDKSDAELRAWLAKRTTSTSVDEVMGLYAPGNDAIALGPLIPLEHRGEAEIRRYQAGRLANVRSISTEVKAVDIESDGKFATVIAAQDVTTTMRDGTRQTQRTNQTNCLRFGADGWRSMMEMVSYPTEGERPVDMLLSPEQRERRKGTQQ